MGQKENQRNEQNDFSPDGQKYSCFSLIECYETILTRNLDSVDTEQTQICPKRSYRILSKYHTICKYSNNAFRENHT